MLVLPHDVDRRAAVPIDPTQKRGGRPRQWQSIPPHYLYHFGVGDSSHDTSACEKLKCFSRSRLPSGSPIKKKREEDYLLDLPC